MQKIFAIIITYNGLHWIDKCLKSLTDSTVPVSIIVIDNGSTDGTSEFVQQHHSEVKFIQSAVNLGFAKANNIGIKQAYDAGADYVFLLNQDAWVEKDSIEKLISTFDRFPDAGIVSPVHLNGKGTDLDFGFKSYLSQNNTADFVSDMYFGNLKAAYETKFVNAAAWMLNRGCIEKVGGFDTSIFYHYGEDDNYSQRVVFHGFKIYICSKATVCHDREQRNGEKTKEFRDKESEIEFRIYYGNVLIADKIVEDKLLYLQSQLTFTYLLLFKFKFEKLKKSRKRIKTEIELINNIKQSRVLNKKGQLIWLD